VRTLDRYFYREAVGPLLLALGVFTFVLAVRPMLDRAEMLLAKGVPVETVGFLLLLLLPQALGITLPMAFLAGLLMTFGRLSGDRETVALLACGVSPLRLLRPVLVLATIAAGLTLYVMVVLLPDSNQKFREITFEYVGQTAESDIKPEMFYEGFPGKVMKVRNVRPGGGWDGVFVADTTDLPRISITTAERGRLVLDKERLIVNIVLEGVTNYVPSDEPGIFTVGEAEASVLQIDPGSVFPQNTSLTRGLAEMPIGQLQDQWMQKASRAQHIQARLAQAGLPAGEAESLRAELGGLSPHNEIMFLHQKFSFPVACIVFALLAVALGFHTRKEGKLGGFTVGLGVIFLYYACMQFAEAGAKSTTHWFDPHWARWFPNLVLGAIGLAAVWWRVRATGHTLSLSMPIWLTRLMRRPQPDVSSAVGAPRAARPVVVVIRIPRLVFPRPRLLDLYVARQFLRIITLTFFGLMVLYYIGTVVDLSEKLFKGQADGWMLAQFLWYSTPRFIYYVVPIATLVAVLGTIGGLTRSSELTVMRACGVSLYRSAAPLLVLGVLSSGFLFYLEERVLAEANRRADQLEDIIRDRPSSTVNIANRNWLIGTGDRIYYYDRFDARSGEIYNLSVFQPAPQPYRLVNEIHAQRAVCPDRICEGGLWEAEQGWEQRFERRGRPDRTPFASRTIGLNPLEDFTLSQVDASMMTFAELREYIRRTRASGFNITEEEVNLQSKIAFPAVALVMTALAIPFAVTTGRRGALYGIGLAIILSVGYWLLTAFFLAAGKAGLLPAPLAAWAANVLFTAAAVYLVLTVRT
jgi:LPS export ABC transporter permease LptG/LPS export ABC transporter permease LptF